MGCHHPALPRQLLLAASTAFGISCVAAVIAGAFKNEPAQSALYWICQQILQG